MPARTAVALLALPILACSGRAATETPAPPPSTTLTPGPTPSPQPPEPEPTVGLRVLGATAHGAPTPSVELDVEARVAAPASLVGHSTCGSIFDETVLVLTDSGGHELLRRPFDYTCSPYAEAQPVTLPTGATTLRFALDAPLDRHDVRATLTGNLAGLPQQRVDTAPVLVLLDEPPPPAHPPGWAPTLDPEANLMQQRPRTPRARVRVREPTVDGELDAALVRRVLLSGSASFEHCFVVQLEQSPAAAGEITFAFTVGASGVVTGASMTNDPSLATTAACVGASLRRLHFPTAAADTYVTVPMGFEQAGSDSD